MLGQLGAAVSAGLAVDKVPGTPYSPLEAAVVAARPQQAVSAGPPGQPTRHEVMVHVAHRLASMSTDARELVQQQRRQGVIFRVA